MKTLKENTQSFLVEVKEVIDNASWNYECNIKEHSDVEKACQYLETQKFSVLKIREKLEEIWTDFLENKHSLCQSHSDCVKLAAEMIANSLAFERIDKFQAKGWRYDGLNSKKWWIGETITFVIN
jgi:hypothetical protein